MSIVRVKSPLGLAAIGVVATVFIALVAAVALLFTGGASLVSKNAALIGALIALGGVFTTQMVTAMLQNQRAQSDALQAYVETIGELLLREEGLHTETESGYVNRRVFDLARAQTKTILERLDPAGKRIVLRYLHDMGVIRNAQLVDLDGANLQQSALQKAEFQGIKLVGVNLAKADMRSIDLFGADLSHANLDGADLRGANLTGTHFFLTNLQNADLREAQGLETEVTNSNMGNKRTRLPGDLPFPAFWSESIDVQRRRIWGGE